jgi:hypothetical protein
MDSTPEAPTLTREEILAALQAALEPRPDVYAMWQGGSAAFGRVDEWSDIDLQVDVADEHAEEILPLVERTLAALSPIDLKFELPQPAWHGHLQTFYRLGRAGRYLLVDFVVIKHSSPLKFLEEEIHGQAVVLFDKAGVISAPPLDRGALREKLRGRLEYLRTIFDLFQILTLKELNRGNALDALVFYTSYTLRPLVEVLRIRYKPERHDFGPRYLYVDLPAHVTQRVERLYFATDLEDLRRKQAEAERWFYEAIDAIDLCE